jgi:hypothetical protein
MELLESHTGVLKKKPEWHTKYYNGRDLNMLLRKLEKRLKEKRFLIQDLKI